MSRKHSHRRTVGRLTAASLALVALTLGSAPSMAATKAAATAPAATTSSVTTVQPVSPSTGIFSAGSVWRQDISRAPLAPNSAAMVSGLKGQVEKYYGGIAAFNVFKHNTSVYTVPASQKRITVKFSNCQNKSYTPAQLYTPSRGAHFVDVPVPSTAIPAANSDGQLTIYSPSSDQLWEFWKMEKRADGWYACWGGRIDKVSTSHGFFPDGMGAAATGLAVSAGSIRVDEAQRGSIDHALSLAIPSPAHWKNFSWPAQRSDGSDTSANAIPEGTRLRLDPSVDVDKLGLTPVGKMVAKSAQKYGFIVTDRSGAVSIQAESGAGAKAATGIDPWTTILGGTPSYLVFKNFPWDKMQALPKDYGKTSSPTVTAPVVAACPA